MDRDAAGIPQDLMTKIRLGQPVSPVIGGLLSAATPLTRLGMWWRLHRPRVCVSARVISFGNITAGGVGKTPAVIARARQELDLGNRVAVLTRGYGACTGMEPVLAGANCVEAPPVHQIGDEAALILRRVPGVLVVKDADRVRGAHAALSAGCDTLLLDDGYQYVMLERDENVVVIDASNPFGNGRLLPRGILREPLSALRRATHVLLTRCDQAVDLDGLERVLRTWLPDQPIQRTRHVPDRLWRVRDGEEVCLDQLRGQPVGAVCAIGHPEAFFRTLEGLGAVLRQRQSFWDHALIPPEALCGTEMLITTEKDAVRMVDAPANVYALGVSLEEI